MSRKASVRTVFLTVLLSPWLAACPSEVERSPMARIEQEVPPLLEPTTAIERIEVVEVGPTKRTKEWAITEPEAIATICRGLRDAIQHEPFEIGLQFFAPKEVRHVGFIRDGQPVLQLISVGDAQFWIAWGDAMRERGGEINFQSRPFEKIADEFFPLVRSAPAIPSDFSLTISREGCEGACPIYTIRLDARGEVVWDGQRDVHLEGVARKTIGRVQLQDVVMAARDREATSFGGAERFCLDTPAVKITLTLDGRTTTATHDSCSQRETREGKAFAAFVEYAESRMQIEDWVKGS